MTRRYVIHLVAIVLAIAAGVISFYLVKKHVTGSSGQAWFDFGCKDSAVPGGANCATVLASPYSVWPARSKDEPTPTFHVPVAWLGLIYYSMLAIWLMGMGVPSPQRRWAYLFPLGFVSIGLMSSVYYLWIMFTEIDAWCLWCLVTHILNFALAAALVWLWPARLQPSPLSTASPKRSTEPTLTVVAPSSRPALWTLFALALALYGHWQFYKGTVRAARVTEAMGQYNTCIQELKEYQKDPQLLMVKWERAPSRELPVYENDPIRPAAPGEKPIDLVIFSDFECFYCKLTAEFLEQKVLPMFDGHVALMFKHYPLDTACNPHSSQTVHKYACLGARMAEAARMLGGNDAFWQAHDLLFAHQDELKNGRLSPDQVAAGLNLDPEAFRQAMDSPEAIEQIREDADLGKGAAVGGTPAIFVGGRRVDRLATREIKFWDEMAERYWRILKTPRPPHTKLLPDPPTPDTPGPKAAP